MISLQFHKQVGTNYENDCCDGLTHLELYNRIRQVTSTNVGPHTSSL